MERMKAASFKSMEKFFMPTKVSLAEKALRSYRDIRKTLTVGTIMKMVNRSTAGATQAKINPPRPL